MVELDTFHSDAFVFIFHLFEFSYSVFSFSLTLSDTTANAQLCLFYFSFVCLLIQLFSEKCSLNSSQFLLLLLSLFFTRLLHWYYQTCTDAILSCKTMKNLNENKKKGNTKKRKLRIKIEKTKKIITKKDNNYVPWCPSVECLLLPFRLHPLSLNLSKHYNKHTNTPLSFLPVVS